MNDGARTGAAIWVGLFAVVGAVLVALALLGPALISLIPRGGYETDCDEPPRYAHWRGAFRSVDEGRDERVRREAAAYLIECRTLHGASKATVQARLGKAPTSEEPDAWQRRHLEYYVGPDGLGIDEETLDMTFDRRGRLTRLEVVQG